MSTETLIALCLAYTLAFLRLARVIKPSYQYFPAWAQIGLTVAVAGLGVFADSLGDDKTKLDLADSVLLALSAGLAAWKGRAAVPLMLLLWLPLSQTGCARVTPEQRAIVYAHEAKAMSAICKAYRFDRATGLVPEVAEAEIVCK
jgi:hypothetical protein